MTNQSTIHSIAEAPPLADLVDALTTAVEPRDTWDETVARVADALRSIPLRVESLGFDAGRGGPDPTVRFLHAAADGSFSIVPVVLAPGQATSIHDHTTWCAFTVIAGEPVEERFVRSGDALVPAETVRCAEGSVSAATPPGDIHRLTNDGSEPTVGVHVYGTDVSRIGSSLNRTYDEEMVR